MNTEEKALVYSVLTQVEYFLDLVKRKNGRDVKDMEVSQLKGFLISKFGIETNPDPWLFFEANGTEGKYRVLFTDEGVGIDRLGEDGLDGDPMAMFPYEKIKGSDGVLLLDIVKVRDMLEV